MEINDENNNNIIDNITTNNKSVTNNDFVPSYMKTNGNTYDINKSSKNISKPSKLNKDNPNKRKLSKFWILIALIVIIVLTFGLIPKISKKIEDSKMTDYDKYMKIYGFSQLYNNGKLNSTDQVKKSELVKMVIASTLNIDDGTINSYIEDKKNNSGSITIDENGDTIISIIDTDEGNEKEKFKNENWVIYAVDNGLIKEGDITDKNFDDSITYIEAIEMLANAKVELLDKNLDTSKVPEFKNYDEYTESEQFALCDLVENEIIENSNNKLNGNKKLTKGILNELIVKYVQKYNLITEDNERINISDEKRPSNEKDFPYTLANIDKSVYEMEMYKENDKYQTPAECYAQIKKQYSSFKTNIELYYNTILNINYQTLNEENFKQNIMDATNEMVSINKINEYIKYVKENKIQVTGKSKVQYPVIYFDGNVYRVRVKLEYSIESSNTLDNILFKDKDTKYNLGKSSTYIDVPINKLENKYYIVTTATDTIIAGRVKKLEQEEVNNKVEDTILPDDDVKEEVPAENNSTKVQNTNNEDSETEFVEDDYKVEPIG